MGTDTTLWQDMINTGNSVLNGVINYQTAQAQNQVAVTEATTASLTAQAKALMAAQTFGVSNKTLLFVAAALGIFMVWKKAA